MRSVSLSDIKGVGEKTLESLKKAGVETLEDLKLADISQLCMNLELSETQLRKILLSAELQAYRVLPEVADALAVSGAIARAGELVALDTEEIQALLTELAKPGEDMDVSIEAIEALKAHVPRLTVDEETTRGVLLEETATALHDEAEPALRAEEPVISKTEVEALIAELENIWQQFLGKMQAIITPPEEAIEFANVQAPILSLRNDIHTAWVQIMEKPVPELGVVMIEDEAPAFADEEIELGVQIQSLSQELAAIQEQLTALKTRRIAADEELSSPAAEEAEEAESTAPRRE